PGLLRLDAQPPGGPVELAFRLEVGHGQVHVPDVGDQTVGHETASSSGRWLRPTLGAASGAGKAKLGMPGIRPVNAGWTRSRASPPSTRVIGAIAHSGFSSDPRS